MDNEKKQTAEGEQQVEPAFVVLEHINPEAKIFYTLDGTYPVPNKAKLYKKPFAVHSDTTVKAVAVVENDVSAVFTKEYKVGK